MTELTLPLHYQSTPKKKVLYSLNQFLAPLGSQHKHNMYHQFKAKKYLMGLVIEMAETIPPVVHYPVQLELTVYRASNHHMDVGNMSILEKYTTDALVKADVFEDDSFKYIDRVTFMMAEGVHPENPRVVYKIIESNPCKE